MLSSKAARLVRAATSFLLASLLVMGCMLKPGRSDVADGKLYEAGEPSYDEFFKSVYAVQLTMGQAPARAENVRQALAKFADATPAASTDELSTAVDKRFEALSKHGVSVKLSATELEGSEPSGKLLTAGTSSDAADGKALSELEQTVKDAATLLTDLRHAKPELERLKEALPPLVAKLDTTFNDAPKRKKAAVKQNLDDADQLIPLMAARSDEVDGRVMELLRTVEKASAPAIATAPPPPPDASPKKIEKKPKGEAKTGAPKTPKEPKAEAPKPPPKEPKAEAPKPPPKEPKAEAPPPKPAEEPKPKPKPKPPADDFEP